MLFVSNQGEQPVRAKLLLDLPRLGLSASLAARDALGERSVLFNGSALELPIGRWQYRVLRIRPQAAS